MLAALWALTASIHFAWKPLHIRISKGTFQFSLEIIPVRRLLIFGVYVTPNDGTTFLYYPMHINNGHISHSLTCARTAPAILGQINAKIQFATNVSFITLSP